MTRCFLLAQPASRIRNRRGTIYIVTLVTTLIVAALGIAALSTVRVQRKQALEADSLRQAECHAGSALQIARFQMRTDPQWRSKLQNGTWASDKPIGTGFYSFSGIDPVDGDLTDSAFEPVIITATGKQSGASQSVSARFEFEEPALTCLQSTLHAGTDLEFHNVTATGNSAPFTANADVRVADNSQVYSNCAAHNQVNLSSNGQVFGTSTNGIPVRQMPDAASLVSYYQSKGTAILATALPLWDQNYVSNPGAEAGTVNPWVTTDCDAIISSDQSRSGSNSFYISNRTLLSTPTVRQDITTKISQNTRYDVSAFVYDPNLLGLLGSCRLQILLRTTDGNVSYTSPWVATQYNQWKPMSFSPTLSWTGTLTKAEVFMETSLLNLLPFYLDDLVMKESDAEPLTYVVHNQLLSPQNNPFTGVTNSSGIYVLNCGGKKIHIRNTRIYGTLVVLNPGAGSKIEGSVCWDPTVVLSTDPSVPNLPALVTDGPLEVSLESTPLSESSVGVNFNPTGSPYAGVTDSDLLDTYPSQISGVLFSVPDFTITKYTTINGTVVGMNKVIVNGTAPAATGVTVTHQPLYYYVNAPIGFRGAPVPKMKPGSVEKVVQ